jgi:DNA polymerase/3'-5' exonuclease PolX
VSRIPLAEAERWAELALWALEPFCSRIVVAGSVRRRVATVKDIELVAEPLEIEDGLFGETRLNTLEIREIAALLGHMTKGGDKYVQVEDILCSGLTLDLFIVTPPAEWGTILAIRTGPADYSHLAVTRIRDRGWRCHEGRITDGRGGHIPTPHEADFFFAADMPMLPPEQRK